jgi:membrane protease YdiL (CAAX protease family)
MSAFAAMGWSLGTTLVFLLLLGVTVAIRPGAERDQVNSFACQLAAYLLGLFLILRLHAPDASIRAFVGIRGTHPGFYGLAAAMGVALSAPVDTLYDAIEHRFPTEKTEGIAAFYAHASTAQRAVLAVIVIALGPILEEVFFRGALLQPLRRRYGGAVALVLSAGLFAVAHVEWQIFAPIALVGLALGLVRTASGSLLPSVLLHATFNGVSFYALATHPESEAETALPLPLTLAMALAAVGLALGTHLLGQRSRLAAHARAEDLS